MNLYPHSARRFVALLTAVLTLFALCACGADQTAAPTESASSSSQTVTSTETPVDPTSTETPVTPTPTETTVTPTPTETPVTPTPTETPVTPTPTETPVTPTPTETSVTPTETPVTPTPTETPVTPTPTETSEPTPTPREIVMRTIKCNFNQANLVSTIYDPKTGKDGAATEYVLWYMTDFIDVSSDYALAYNLAGHKYLYSVAFYDADRNFIGGDALPTVSRGATQRAVTIRPGNARYARFANFVSGDGSFKDPFVYGIESAEDYDEYMRQHPRTNYRIALLGDSLTEGDQGTNTAGVGSIVYRNYPYYLAEILDCTTENFGKCGYTTESYLMCYSSEVDVSQADLILVMLGTNAGIGTKSLQQRYRGLLKQIEKDKKEGAVVVLVTPPHATEIEGKVNYGYNPNVLSAAEYVRSYAASKGYVLIDAYTDSPIQEPNEAIYQPNDGLHMNPTGYKAFAQFIADQLIEKGILV